MINKDALDLADMAGILQPLIDTIPGPIRTVDLYASGGASVHTGAHVKEFPDEQVWDENISPTWTTELNINGLPVTVFASGPAYGEDDAA